MVDGTEKTCDIAGVSDTEKISMAIAQGDEVGNSIRDQYVTCMVAEQNPHMLESSSGRATAEALPEKDAFEAMVMAKLRKLEDVSERILDVVMNTGLNASGRWATAAMDSKRKVQRMQQAEDDSQLPKEGLHEETWPDLEALESAIVSSTPVKGVVTKWFADQGYGFLKVAQIDVFCQIRSLRGATSLRTGEPVMVVIISDDTVKANGYRAKSTWTAMEWWKKLKSELAEDLTTQIDAAAQLTARLTARTRTAVADLLNFPVETLGGDVPSEGELKTPPGLFQKIQSRGNLFGKNRRDKHSKGKGKSSNGPFQTKVLMESELQKFTEGQWLAQDGNEDLEITVVKSQTLFGHGVTYFCKSRGLTGSIEPSGKCQLRAEGDHSFQEVEVKEEWLFEIAGTESRQLTVKMKTTRESLWGETVALVKASERQKERKAVEEIARQKAEAEKIAAQTIARQKVDAEKAAAEKFARQKSEEDNAAAERIARQKAEEAKVAAEKIARQNAEEEKAEAVEIARQKAAQQKAASEGEIKGGPTAQGQPFDGSQKVLSEGADEVEEPVKDQTEQSSKCGDELTFGSGKKGFVDSSDSTYNRSSSGGLFGCEGCSFNSSGTSGLFGSSGNTSNSSSIGGIFGSGANTSNRSGGGGLFGSGANTCNSSGGGGLFGSGANTDSAGGGGLFGSGASTSNSSGGGGLFGSGANTLNSSGGGGLCGTSGSSPSAQGKAELSESEDEDVKPQLNRVSASVAQDVDKFVKDYGIDDRAKEKMHNSVDEVVSGILNKGLSDRVRNPSAYVTKAVSRAEKELVSQAAEQWQEGGDDMTQWQEESHETTHWHQGGGETNQWHEEAREPTGWQDGGEAAQWHEEAREPTGWQDGGDESTPWQEGYEAPQQQDGGDDDTQWQGDGDEATQWAEDGAEAEWQENPEDDYDYSQ